MQALVPLMLVPLLVFVGFWAYLWSLDGKIKRLEHEIRGLDEPESDT